MLKVGLLYYKGKQLQEMELLVVPTKLRPTVMKLVHDISVAGLLAVDKTLA